MHICTGGLAKLRANVHDLFELPKALLGVIFIKAYLVKSVERVCCVETLATGTMT